MPQVPYQPYPTAQPSTGGTPNLKINAPSAAFGENIGAAIEGFGKGLEEDSDKIFQRAIALQELQNETAARNAGMKVVEDVGKLHANFNALEGVNAGPKALEKYSADLNDVYQGYRTQLPNDDARRRYDAFALSVVKQATNSGAGHSAKQTKEAADQSVDANVRARYNQMYTYPTDENGFNENLRGVQRELINKAAIHGWTQDKISEQSFELSSGAWSSRMIGLSRTQPQAALQMLDAHRSELTEKDFLRADNVIRGQARAVGAANIANNVYNSNLDEEGNPTKSSKDMEDEARAQAAKAFPDDPIAANHAVSALHSRLTDSRNAKRQENFDNMQIISDGIKRGVKDERELRLDPQIARAIDSLSSRKQLDIPGMINRYNAAKNKADNDENFYQLKGLSNNNVEEFLNTDLTKYNLSLRQLDQLNTIRSRLTKSQDQDPRVGRAIGWMQKAMGAQMEALGIFKRTENNKNDFDHFTGTLQSALDLWLQDKGKPPTYNEFIDKIAPEVIRTRKESAWFGLSTNDVPFFTQTVPEKWSDDFKAAVTARGLAEPSTEEVYKAYVRSQLIQLHDSQASQRDNKQ